VTWLALSKEKTVVIDECSMLTMDDLFAVLAAFDMAHVQRLIWTYQHPK
jgi:hypothetical protein